MSLTSIQSWEMTARCIRQGEILYLARYRLLASVGQLEQFATLLDFNHTAPEDLAAFEALIPRMSLLHVSDTPLPEVNHHLPLGLGNIDFAAYCQTLIERGFNGPAILEIGGLPKSGGYGRDTDEALMDSLRRLQAAMP